MAVKHGGIGKTNVAEKLSISREAGKEAERSLRVANVNLTELCETMREHFKMASETRSSNNINFLSVADRDTVTLEFPRMTTSITVFFTSF
jgi:hypothetical protein